VERRRRIAVHGLCHDTRGRVLLVRSSAATGRPGLWSLPGGGVAHGEHPADTIVREFREETGLTVAVRSLRAVLADVGVDPARTELRHTDRIVYEVAIVAGALRSEVDGTTDLAEFVAPERVPDMPLLAFTAALFGVPTAPEPDPPPAAAPASPAGPAGARRGQRFGAYGLVTDPAGRILLTLIADGYPGSGRWHLPGGGTDHGEQPEAAFLRELAEETAQVGRVTGLLDVSSSHNPAAVGPEGHPVDWHVVRVIYRAVVDAPTPAAVTESAGGSTASAAWLTAPEAARLSLTEVAEAAVRELVNGSASPSASGRASYNR
jgi:ADP-ribose pyrophosphatase YjhB (NUDIX family)